MKTKKRTILDALAEKAAAKASGKPAVPAKVPEEERPDYGMIVTFLCGHKDVFELGYHATKCMNCRLFEQRDAATLAAVRLQHLAKSPPAKPQPAPSKGVPKRPDIPGRLPDGAVFHLLYNASTQTWWGTLKIGDAEFSGEKGGVFKLLRILDAEYRKSLAPVAEAAK